MQFLWATGFGDCAAACAAKAIDLNTLSLMGPNEIEQALELAPKKRVVNLYEEVPYVWDGMGWDGMRGDGSDGKGWKWVE